MLRYSLALSLFLLLSLATHPVTAAGICQSMGTTSGVTYGANATCTISGGQEGAPSIAICVFPAVPASKTLHVTSIAWSCQAGAAGNTGARFSANIALSFLPEIASTPVVFTSSATAMYINNVAPITISGTYACDLGIVARSDSSISLQMLSNGPNWNSCNAGLVGSLIP